MSDRPVIPDEAVEAALSALFPDRATVSPFTRAVQEPIIRTILEAAAPHMLAAAYDLGIQHGANQPPNPYRARADQVTSSEETQNA